MTAQASAAAAAAAEPHAQERLLTILIQTSPIPSHPSTALLEALFRSFAKLQDVRRLAQIYILCDGCDEVTAEQAQRKDGTKRGCVSSDRAEAYRQHLELLRSKLNQPPFAPSVDDDVASCSAVEMIELSERHGSALAIQRAQHDNFFVSDVPLPAILQTMQLQWIKCLHFVSTATLDYVNKVKNRYDMDLNPLVRRDVGTLHHPLIPLVFWFGRTAISRTDYYTDFVLDRTIEKGDHLEELLGVLQLEDMKRRGPEIAHPTWGNFLLEQGKEVIYHLSGRRARAVCSNVAKKSDNAEEICETNTSTGNDRIQSIDSDHNLPGWAPIDKKSASFATARSARAIVPGLEILNTDASTGNDNGDGEAPRGKFKQRCFHCGKKGHSFRWCPDREKDQMPKTETIDLA